MKLRRVPVALTSGWGGFRAYRARPSLQPGARPVFLQTSPGRATSAPGAAIASRSMNRMYTFEADGAPLASDPRPSIVEPMLSRLTSRPASISRTDALVVLQAADGSWDLTKKFAAVIASDLDELRAEVKHAAGPRDLVHRTWATALALAWLECNAGDTRDEWQMLADKAREWIDRAAVVPPEHAEWLALAHRFLAR